MKLLHYALAAAIITIIVMIFLWPSGGTSKEQIEREAQYARQAAIDRTDKIKTQKTSDSVVKAKDIRIQKDSLEMTVLKNENKRLRRNRDANRPNVQPYLDSIPVLKSFVAQQDSLIDNQDSIIAKLNEMNYRAAKEFDALSIAMVDERKISEKMIQDCESNREALKGDLEKATKKEVRKVKFWKAAAVVLGVGGFLAGTNL